MLVDLPYTRSILFMWVGEWFDIFLYYIGICSIYVYLSNIFPSLYHRSLPSLAPATSIFGPLFAPSCSCSPSCSLARSFARFHSKPSQSPPQSKLDSLKLKALQHPDNVILDASTLIDTHDCMPIISSIFQSSQIGWFRNGILPYQVYVWLCAVQLEAFHKFANIQQLCGNSLTQLAIVDGYWVDGIAALKWLELQSWVSFKQMLALCISLKTTTTTNGQTIFIREMLTRCV